MAYGDHKYRIPFNNVPTGWKEYITPQQDEQGLYYDVNQLAEHRAIYPMAQPYYIGPGYYYKTDTTTHMDGYCQYIKDSNERLAPGQETIPELQYQQDKFLALVGGSPGLGYDPRGSGGNVYGKSKYDGGTLHFVRSGDGSSSMIEGIGGFTYTNYYGPGGTRPYAEFAGGCLYQCANFSTDMHYFHIWIGNPDEGGIGVEVCQPATPGGGSGDYDNIPRRTGIWTDKPIYAVNIVIVAAGGPGHSGSFGANGAGGGGGAMGVFTVDLRDTNEDNYVIVALGGYAGSNGTSKDSGIYYYSGYSNEGYRIGAGGCGRSDSDMGKGGFGGEVKDGFGSGHGRILLVNNVDGAAGGKRLTQHGINVGDSCFTTFESTAKGSGGGGASAAANGGKLGGYTIAGGSFGAEHGTPGDFPGGGGGAGKGPSGLGGDGGAGGAAGFGIIY